MLQYKVNPIKPCDDTGAMFLDSVELERDPFYVNYQSLHVVIIALACNLSLQNNHEVSSP